MHTQVIFRLPILILMAPRLSAYRFELSPSMSQVRIMQRTAGTCRYVYNRALALQQTRRAAGEKRLGYKGLCAELTAWRNDPSMPWLAECSVSAQQQVLRDLERGFANFFAKRAAPPTFKKKGRSRTAYRCQAPRDCRVDPHAPRVLLPKIGWVRYRASRPVLGTVRSMTVSETTGRWFVSILTEREVETPVHSSTTSVGIDVGVANLAALSDGTRFAGQDSFRRHERRLARAQRALSRKKRGSRNAAKARRHVARIHARIAAVRNDYLHKCTSTISQTHAIVCIEDLQVRAMSASARGTPDRPGRRVRQKAGLNKAILDQGWGEFRRQLAYKVPWAGGTLVVVPPAYTSQTCPPALGGCGHVAAENRTSQAAFRCVACGVAGHADVIAAMNIKAKGLKLLEAAGHAASACGGRALGGTPTKQEPADTTAARTAA